MGTRDRQLSSLSYPHKHESSVPINGSAEKSRFSGEEVLYVVCAQSAYTTYRTPFFPTALFSGQSSILTQYECQLAP
jgi:hypothetical protein